MLSVRLGVQCFALIAVAALASVAGAAGRTTGVEQRMERRLAALRQSPPELYAFLLKMPKGGDLHHHLGGAVYAENLADSAAAQDLCVDAGTWAFAFRSPAGTCASGQLQAKTASQDNDDRNHLIDSLSMRDFVPAVESAHDHFFAAFGKFQPVGRAGNPDFLAQVIRRAAEQNESYLETMALSGGAPLAQVASRADYSEDFATFRSHLMDAGLPAAVAELKTRVDGLEAKRRSMLRCEVEPSSAACRVVIRYIFQVQREFPKRQVFAQILAGFLLAAEDPRVASVNLVQPEDGVTALRDYHLHMEMLQYVRGFYPKVPLTLHAGELALGLVPPEELRFHIREAVEIAGAQRIGHGVDVNYELNSEALLKRLAERRTAVEINLTSNDLILGVKGIDHPLPVYLKYGVPVVLCTDDEGVSRSHLTQEYLRATTTYKLTYGELKRIVRNSLEFSFLPGASWWRNDAYEVVNQACVVSRASKACRGFLASSAKATAQADLEDRFAEFEKPF